jgi:hypothetical protein
MKYQVLLISAPLEEIKRVTQEVATSMGKATKTEGVPKGKKFQEVASILEKAWSRMTFDAITEATSLVDKAKDTLMTIRALARQESDRWAEAVADKALKELSSIGIIVDDAARAELQPRTLTIELVGLGVVTDDAVRRIVKAMAEIARDGISPLASPYTSINPTDSDSEYLLTEMKIPRVLSS